MITSAINTKFGVFTSDQRLQQTIDTINSIAGRVAGVKIYLVEMSAIPLTQEQRSTLALLVDDIVDFDDNQDVKDIFNGSNNWDWVKNATEVMCFSQAVSRLDEQGAFADVDRIHKVSGRYTLSDDFDLSVFEQNPDKIVIKTPMTSQFPAEVTGNIPLQYMSRLWSWPVGLTEQVLETYYNGFDYIAQRISEGGYCDIEHMLFKFLPPEHICEIARTGISGNLGPNGVRIND
jgi:hypothetical protein